MHAVLKSRCSFGPILIAHQQPLLADGDAVCLLRDLCPEAAARLYGDGGRTPVELFCEEHPAPADVRL